MRTGKWRENSIAWGLVLLWHLLLLWVLARASRIQPSHDDDPAMQVVYVSVPEPVASVRMDRAPAAHRPPLRARRSRLQADAQTAPALQAVDVQPAVGVVFDTASVSMQQYPIDFARHNPLADRPLSLAAAGRARFRMKPARSLQSVVATIGAYIAPRGYDPDPCPRNLENIGNLMAGQDRQALEQELDFERRHCRP